MAAFLISSSFAEKYHKEFLCANAHSSVRAPLHRLATSHHHRKYTRRGKGRTCRSHAQPAPATKAAQSTAVFQESIALLNQMISTSTLPAGVTLEAAQQACQSVTVVLRGIGGLGLSGHGRVHRDSGAGP